MTLALCLKALSLAFLFMLLVPLGANAVPIDFSGMWVPAEQKLVIRPDMNNPKYTDKSQQEIDRLKTDFDLKTDDPGRFCLPNGMPWIVATRAPFSVEILQQPQQIYMLYEAHSDVRRIFMDGRTMPTDFTPTQNGYSTAKWDGDILLVETTGLSSRGPYVLLKRSEKTKIHERWAMIKHPKYGQAIEINMLMEDFENYAEPRPAYQLLVRAPVGTIISEYGCAGSTFWDPFIAKRVKEVEAKKAASLPASTFLSH